MSGHKDRKTSSEDTVALGTFFVACNMSHQWGSYVRRLDQSKKNKRRKHVEPLKPSIERSKLCPSAQGFLQSLADVACSTGVVDRGLWLRSARQCLRCALARGRVIVFRDYCQRSTKSAGKDFRDGAVVPFE